MKVAYFLSALDLLIIFSLYLGGTCSSFVSTVACTRHGRILDDAGEQSGGSNGVSNGVSNGGASGKENGTTNVTANDDTTDDHSHHEENSDSETSESPTTDAQNTHSGSESETDDHTAEAPSTHYGEHDGEYYEGGDTDESYDLSEHEENKKFCLENNGGCGDDKICEDLGQGIVKCLCKPGFKLVGTECVEASKSSSLNSVFCWFLLLIIFLASINYTMAIVSVVLAIHLFLLCSYHSGHTLEVSLWRQENAHLETQTNRLLRENGKNDHVLQVESTPISGREGNKEIGMISNLQLQSGEDEGSSQSQNNSNTERTNEEPTGENREEEEEKANAAADSAKEASTTEEAKAEVTKAVEDGKKEEQKIKELATKVEDAEAQKPKEESEKAVESAGKSEEEGESTKKEESEEKKGSEEKSVDNKDEKTPEGGDTEENKNLESKQTDVEVSEHKQDGDSPKEDKNSQNGENKKEGSSNNNSNQENPENAGNEENKPHLDGLDDEVPHPSSLRNNRIEDGVTDTMMLKDIIGDKTKSCSVNNGGCSDDQICIRINNVGIKCICKEGYSFGGKCILSRSSALSSFFSAGLFVLLTLLWMF
ncbi:Merozoite surface protein 4 [Plasmodium coatneyi]|uniref:Merozoite surface protein 4 n=1 Tax=Plasmodium coatneyi TaxID=208452 RepID=A0A1B1DV23_9APIC|nr:Merozoite surface protein 4 [Plasmodium coatneyi]ANQ06641.1 Merozoite surface protein 4 [Plasmodium coatneyi]